MLSSSAPPSIDCAISMAFISSRPAFNRLSSNDTSVEPIPPKRSNASSYIFVYLPVISATMAGGIKRLLISEYIFFCRLSNRAVTSFIPDTNFLLSFNSNVFVNCSTNASVCCDIESKFSGLIFFSCVNNLARSSKTRFLSLSIAL